MHAVSARTLKDCRQSRVYVPEEAVFFISRFAWMHCTQHKAHTNTCRIPLVRRVNPGFVRVPVLLHTLYDHQDLSLLREIAYAATYQFNFIQDDRGRSYWQRHSMFTTKICQKFITSAHK